jgi:hypothetical protein
VLAAIGPTNPAFYLLALAVISVNRFFLSALSASLPHVVDRGRLVSANSLSVTSGTFAAILGAGVGVGLRSLAGGSDAASALVALLGGAGYLLSSLIARGFRVDELGPEVRSTTRLRSEMRRVAIELAQGARHIVQRRPAAAALAAISAHRFFYGISTVATLLVYRNYFTDDGWLRAGLSGLTQVVVATGIGTLLGALLTPPISRRIGKPLWLVVVLAFAAAVEIVFGLPYTKGTLLVAALGLGLASQASKIVVDTTVQESVADAFRGRVFSVYDTLFNLTFVLAAALASAFLPDNGVSRAVVGVIAAGYAATAIGYALASVYWASGLRDQAPESGPVNP